MRHLTLVTAPAAEPITLSEAKERLKITVTDDDTLIEDTLILGARDRGELATQRAFITQTWDLVLDGGFPCEDWIEIPKPPLQSVTSLKYIDLDGVEQTWSSTNYTVDAPAGPRAARGRVLLNYGQSWPSAREQANAVTVRFICGYGDDNTGVPPALKAALAWDVGADGNLVGPEDAALFREWAGIAYRRFKSRPTQW